MSIEVSTPTIADLASIVIATLALVATAWQGAIARRHNKLSVMPMIVHHNETNITEHGLTVSYVIKNVGTGPALIQDRYFQIQGNRFNPIEPSSLLKELCETLIGRSLAYRIVSSGLFGSKAKLPSGAEVTILKLFFPGLKEEQAPIVVALADKADFFINYESIYGEKFTYRSDE